MKADLRSHGAPGSGPQAAEGRPKPEAAASPGRDQGAATLWFKNEAGGFTPLVLRGDGAVDLAVEPPRAVQGALAAGAPPAALLLPARRGALGAWVLIANPQAEVRVNGFRLAMGIRALGDRDEIRVGHNPPVYFSREAPAEVQPFPGAERPVPCPRCRLAIEPGEAAVRCPSCGVWHHQLDDRPCYTYAPHCAACGAPAELNGDYRWVPEV